VPVTTIARSSSVAAVCVPCADAELAAIAVKPIPEKSTAFSEMEARIIHSPKASAKWH
jgi:hypothetical protein